MSSLQSIASRLTGAGYTSRVAQWRQGSLIRSIQRATITVANGALTNTATLSPAVVPGNSRLVHLGNTSVNGGGGGSGAGPTELRLTFTDGTTITATRTDTTDDAVVSFEVIEYWPGVLRSVQRGTIALAGAASNTGALSPALQSTSKATLDYLGCSGSVAFSADNFLARMVLTNTTTVTYTRIGTNGTLTGGFQVVEWW